MHKITWIRKLQHVKKTVYLLSLLIAGLLLLNQQVSESYIARRYSVPQICQ